MRHPPYDLHQECLVESLPLTTQPTIISCSCVFAFPLGLCLGGVSQLSSFISLIKYMQKSKTVGLYTKTNQHVK